MPEPPPRSLLCRLGFHTADRSQGVVGYCLRDGCDDLRRIVSNGRLWTRYTEPGVRSDTPPTGLPAPLGQIDKMLDQLRRPATRWNGFGDLDLLEVYVNLTSADEWINPDRSRGLLIELSRELEVRGYVQDEITLAWRISDDA